MRHSHCQHAHLLWSQWLRPGDWVIDATCGNGHDTLKLSELVKETGGVIALDFQEDAIKETKRRVKAANVYFFCQSHVTFPSIAQRHPIRLIVYNLGYLPGGNKKITTLRETSLASLQSGLSLLEPNGLISLTCYPGHPEGEAERLVLLQFAAQLDPRSFNVSHTVWENRESSPSLLIIQKKILPHCF